jgi:hypothetical protein
MKLVAPFLIFVWSSLFGQSGLVAESILDVRNDVLVGSTNRTEKHKGENGNKLPTTIHTMFNSIYRGFLSTIGDSSIGIFDALPNGKIGLTPNSLIFYYDEIKSVEIENKQAVGIIAISFGVAGTVGGVMIANGSQSQQPGTDHSNSTGDAIVGGLLGYCAGVISGAGIGYLLTRKHFTINGKKEKFAKMINRIRSTTRWKRLVK